MTEIVKSLGGVQLQHFRSDRTSLYSVALGMPYRSALPAGLTGPALSPSRTAALIFSRSCHSSGGRRHNSIMDLFRDSPAVRGVLVGPFPPLVEGVFLLRAC